VFPLFATNGKFATSVVDTGGNLPPMSLTPAENLLQVPPVSLTPAANLLPVALTPVANLPPLSTTLAVLAANLLPLSLILVVHLVLEISLRIFEKIQNDLNNIIRGLGEDDSRIKPEAKNLVTLSL
jgi:hypothetical protein